jgi:ribosomal protein S18 acetylase RimI-like enzyme
VEKVSNDIIEKWLKGWSLSRELPLPFKYESGFRVDVGYEKQKIRYVFSELNEDFFRLANQVDEPWIFLKVCKPFDEFKNKISEKWKVQPEGYMMTCFHSMKISDAELKNGYKIQYENYNSTFVVKILTNNDEIASIGRVVLVNDLAIYDRISTDEKHRKKGLASFLMTELEKIALSKGITNNFLVATKEGRRLYEALGWELYSVFTSIVISNEM